MFVKINGERHYLWRAVDHEGEVLEICVTKKRFGRAEAIVADGMRSHPAAMRELGKRDRREMGRWLNNRVENVHLPFQPRERAMLRFRPMKSLQKFASVRAALRNHFSQERHLVDRQTCKIRRLVALADWQSLMA